MTRVVHWLIRHFKRRPHLEHVPQREWIITGDCPWKESISVKEIDK
jgi:hypothetical protein